LSRPFAPATKQSRAHPHNKQNQNKQLSINNLSHYRLQNQGRFQKAFNSLGAFTSKRSILRLRKILAGVTHGLCLEESQPQVQTFRMFCNQISNPITYVAQPADATFAD
jgi:hypothetical protein